MKPVKYSWILPVKDEAESLPQLISEISKVMEGKKYEIIAVNDGSTDLTPKILKDLKKLKTLRNRLKIITFKPTQGKWACLGRGFSRSSGEIIITLDSDLQDDPMQVKKLLAKMEDGGFDLVSGMRKKRFDPLYKALTSRVGNFLVSSLSKQAFRDINSPFKVYKRQVLKELPVSGSLLRFSLLFAGRLGFRIKEVEIIHRPRLYGKSKFGVKKYIRILYDLVLVMLLFSGSGRLNKR